MLLNAGRRLGAYEITAHLGSGGMGEVYRARDTRLQRDVAIKVLPDLFTQDPGRLARFEREAQMLASLNHPHIAGIYGVEDAGPVRGLVLELVEGPTLAERIARGPLAVPEALAIAAQIADALEAAHTAGIVHRDLEARKHQGAAGRVGQGAGLRARQGRGRANLDGVRTVADDHGGDTDRDDSRHRPVYGA